MPPSGFSWPAVRTMAILMNRRTRLFADRPTPAAVASARSGPLKVSFLHGLGD